MKTIKRYAYAVCLLIAFASCGGDSGPSSEPSPSPVSSTTVTGISLSKTSLTLVEGGSEIITATVIPSTAINKNVTWSSSDSDIATVDNEGKISAKKPGSAKITVKTVDGGKIATLNLTVDLDYIARQKAILKKLYDSLGGASWTKKDGWNTDAELKDWFGITMNGNFITNINLKNNNLKGKIPASLGETLAITRMLIEAETRTEDNKYATTRAEETVSIFGNLKELDLSNNEITGTIPPEIGNLSNLNNLNLSDNSISGTIPPEVGNLTNLTNLDLGSNNISGSIPVEVGKLTNLTNLDLGGNDLTGSVPDELGNLSKLENLNVSENKLSGEISTALQESDMWKNLKDEPELKQQGGSELEKEVKIITPVTGVTLDNATLELTEGETATLTATVAPSDASQKSVSWSSSDSNVATVDKGVVKAVAPGRATITVTTKDGGKTAVCKVSVKAAVIAVTGVTLSKSSLELIVGGTETLTATVSPIDATEKTVSWSSSNSSVATIDANGKITAIAAGNATITVTTKDGNKTTSCIITVINPTIAVTGITLDKTTLDLLQGSTYSLTATIAPANATNKEMTWSSSDVSIAKVENGKVTAMSSGTATISVTTKDSNKTATCTVNVTAASDTNVEDFNNEKIDW